MKGEGYKAWSNNSMALDKINKAFCLYWRCSTYRSMVYTGGE